MITGWRAARVAVFAVAGALCAPGVPLAAGEAGAGITEWRVPWENTRPRDPWVQGPERVWFVGQTADYVGVLNPQTGTFRRYDLEEGAGPHTVIADERGVWYAGNRARHIGRLDPDSGAIERIELPGDGRGDVHTMDFASDGSIWFTVQHGNAIGRLAPNGRDITLHDVATPGARPYGLLVDGDDTPWIALFGTNRLATVRDGEVVEIELPRPESRPRRLALPGDGGVWYVDYEGGYLGRYDIVSGEVREWRTPGERRSRPYALSSDDRGRLWFVETGMMPNRLIGFDPRAEHFSDPVGIGSGGGTVRHMVYDAATDAVWFGTDANTIGRAILPE